MDPQSAKKGGGVGDRGGYPPFPLYDTLLPPLVQIPPPPEMCIIVVTEHIQKQPPKTHQNSSNHLLNDFPWVSL